MTRRQYQFTVYAVHLLASMTTLILIVLLLPGFRLQTSLLGLLAVTLVFAFLTTVIKPLLESMFSMWVVLYSTTFAITVNTLLLYLTSLLTDGVFEIDNLLWALLGGTIVGMISAAVNVIAEMVEGRMFKQYQRQRRSRIKTRIEEIRAQATRDDDLIPRR